MRFDKYIVPIVPSFDAAPLYQDLVAAITTLFTVYTGVQIKFKFSNKNKNAFSPGWPWLNGQTKDMSQEGISKTGEWSHIIQGRNEG